MADYGRPNVIDRIEYAAVEVNYIEAHGDESKSIARWYRYSNLLTIKDNSLFLHDEFPLDQRGVVTTKQTQLPDHDRSLLTVGQQA